MVIGPTSKKRLILGCLLGVVALFGFAAVFGCFGYTSVCRRCGAVRNTREWHIPLTPVVIFRHSSDRETPVSQELQRSGIVGNHEHQWLFAVGGGNGVKCALGSGRHILACADSDGVAQLIEATHKFHAEQFQAKLLHALFEPSTSEAARQLGLSMPARNFEHQEEWNSWMAENNESFDELVAQFKR